MSLKSILLFISIPFCYTSKAQIDTIYVDSVRKTASEFSKSVHRIELVALIPYSKTRYHKYLWLFNRKFTYYIPASIIKSSNSPDISTKIKGEMIGDRCDFDMTLKDSLFQALFYNELVTSHTVVTTPEMVSYSTMKKTSLSALSRSVLNAVSFWLPEIHHVLLDSSQGIWQI